MKQNKTFIISTLFLICSVQAFAQVTIGSNEPPELYSVLQLDGRTGGLRMPRLSAAERETLTSMLQGDQKSHGLTIYNIDNQSVDFWDGKSWVSLKPQELAADNGLSVSSNTVSLGGTLRKDTEINIGTYNLSLPSLSGNINMLDNTLFVDGQSKNVGIGTNAPAEKLDVNGTVRLRTLDAADVNDNLVVERDGVLHKISTQDLIDYINSQSLKVVGGTVAVILGSSGGASGSGVTTTTGSGYTVNHLDQGLFEITFDKPFKQIQGMTCNIVDAYLSSSNIPNLSNIGIRLRNTDNIHLTYMSNEKIRLRTGDDLGKPGSRSFIFVVMGTN